MSLFKVFWSQHLCDHMAISLEAYYTWQVVRSLIFCMSLIDWEVILNILIGTIWLYWWELYYIWEAPLIIDWNLVGLHLLWKDTMEKLDIQFRWDKKFTIIYVFIFGVDAYSSVCHEVQVNFLSEGLLWGRMVIRYSYIFSH